jgi:hypothetical protein
MIFFADTGLPAATVAHMYIVFEFPEKSARRFVSDFIQP